MPTSPEEPRKETIDRFVYVEDGEIEVVNVVTGERLVPSTLGPGQFMSEIALLGGGSTRKGFVVTGGPRS